MGLELRRAGTATRNQIVEAGVAKFGVCFEAFPNAFIGVLVHDAYYRKMPELKRGQKFDWLYDTAILTRAFDDLYTLPRRSCSIARSDCTRERPRTSCGVDLPAHCLVRCCERSESSWRRRRRILLASTRFAVAAMDPISTAGDILVLVIRAIQRKNEEGICEYEVAAFLNTRKIWQGTVGGHKRDQGWAVLAGHIERVAGSQSDEEKLAIEDALKAIDESGDGLVHCPFCNKVLNYR